MNRILEQHVLDSRNGDECQREFEKSPLHPPNGRASLMPGETTCR